MLEDYTEIAMMKSAGIPEKARELPDLKTRVVNINGKSLVNTTKPGSIPELVLSQNPIAKAKRFIRNSGIDSPGRAVRELDRASRRGVSNLVQNVVKRFF